MTREDNKHIKFIGGAEKARRSAQNFLKKHGNVRNEHQHQHQHNNTKRRKVKNHGGGTNRSGAKRLSKRMKPYDRFYASLLQHDIIAIQQSNKCELSWNAFMVETCQYSLGIPIPSALPSTYKDINQYYMLLSSLVIEESRCVLADALNKLNSSRSSINRNSMSISINAKKNNNYYRMNNGNNRQQHRQIQPQSQQNVGGAYVLHLINAEKEKTGFVSMTFARPSSTPFTNKELYDMKPGCVFEVTTVISKQQHYQHQQQDQRSNSDNNKNNMTNDHPEISFLASVIPMANKDKDGVCTLPLMMYNKNIASILENSFQTSSSDDDGINDNYNDGSSCSSSLSSSTRKWFLRPITSLISEQRQFDACMKAPKVSFKQKLLGMKTATHTRFDDSDDDSSSSSEDDEKIIDYESNRNNEDGSSGKGGGHSSCIDLLQQDREKKSLLDTNNIPEMDDVKDDTIQSSNNTLTFGSIRIPLLNGTQEKAATSFLNSSLSTITLVQGPPGTGKSTFMTSVLCKSFFESYDDGENIKFNVNYGRRILVTAPTNKAISVLTSRFLQSLNGCNDLNIVLIGVEEKLIPEDADSNEATRFKSILVYTWVEEMVERYLSLGREAKRCRQDDDVYKRKSMMQPIIIEANLLMYKVKHSIPYLSKKSGLLDLARNLTGHLETLLLEETSSDRLSTNESSQLMQILSMLISALENLARKDVIDELLATANVIFCTLSSAGVSAMKRTRQVDDLFVDEAAAATEPELIIPFHLRPGRLLMVGDPKQLPATIISQRAAKFGLDKSLLDRLMHDFNDDHTMLDVQYRMKPCISAFPNSRFYKNKLSNGENVKSLGYRGDISLNGNSHYAFMDVPGEEQRHTSGSYYNAFEANAIVGILKQLRDASRVLRNGSIGETCFSPEKVRIITFYQGQVVCIRSMLQRNGFGRVLVATVDSSQGCEADIVIVSFVRSNKKMGLRAKAGFLDDDRRINVALTRAKYHLICVGDTSHLLSCGASTLKLMVEDAKARGLVYFGQRTLQMVAHEKEVKKQENACDKKVIPNHSLESRKRSNNHRNGEIQKNTKRFNHTLNDTNLSNTRNDVKGETGVKSNPSDNDSSNSKNGIKSETGIKSSPSDIHSSNSEDDLKCETEIKSNRREGDSSKSKNVLKCETQKFKSNTSDNDSLNSRDNVKRETQIKPIPVDLYSSNSKNDEKSETGIKSNPSNIHSLTSKNDTKRETVVQCRLRKLKSLRQKLPFVQTDLMEKKKICIQISKIEKSLSASTTK